MRREERNFFYMENCMWLKSILATNNGLLSFILKWLRHRNFAVSIFLSGLRFKETRNALKKFLSIFTNCRINWTRQHLLSFIQSKENCEKWQKYFSFMSVVARLDCMCISTCVGSESTIQRHNNNNSNVKSKVKEVYSRAGRSDQSCQVWPFRGQKANVAFLKKFVGLEICDNLLSSWP